MNHDDFLTANPAVFTTIFQQNWENVRHIKSERIWFTNIFSMISAGTLSLLQSIHGKVVVQQALVLFLCVFSLIGLLTSLRLKAELEECLGKLQAMVAQIHVGAFVALGQSEGDLSRYPKFRWIFPVFYSMTTAGFTVLFACQLLAGDFIR